MFREKKQSFVNSESKNSTGGKSANQTSNLFLTRKVETIVLLDILIYSCPQPHDSSEDSHLIDP